MTRSWPEYTKHCHKQVEAFTFFIEKLPKCLKQHFLNKSL
jgi:hypothetical protein